MRRVYKFKTEEEKKNFIGNYCPNEHGLDDVRDILDGCNNISCKECWEQSGVELVVEETEDFEKENKKMAVKRNLTAEEVIENLQKQVAELQEEQKKLEKYKSYRDTADEIAAMRSAFVEAGFSDEEAFTLVSGMVDKVINAAVRRYL